MLIKNEAGGNYIWHNHLHLYPTPAVLCPHKSLCIYILVYVLKREQKKREWCRYMCLLPEVLEKNMILWRDLQHWGDHKLIINMPINEFDCTLKQLAEMKYLWCYTDEKHGILLCFKFKAALKCNFCFLPWWLNMSNTFAIKV